jgi:hypothetical protein
MPIHSKIWSLETYRTPQTRSIDSNSCTDMMDRYFRHHSKNTARARLCSSKSTCQFPVRSRSCDQALRAHSQAESQPRSVCDEKPTLHLVTIFCTFTYCKHWMPKQTLGFGRFPSHPPSDFHCCRTPTILEIAADTTPSRSHLSIQQCTGNPRVPTRPLDDCSDRR